MNPSPQLSVIIPAYHQARTICGELATLQNYFSKALSSYEIILVIDGNEDGTLEKVMQTTSFPELHVACFEQNQGKGAAVRYGFQIAKGELVAFMDAGGDLKPEDLKHMIDEMKMNQADIVIGSKRHISSHVSYPRLRRVYSYVYQLLNRLLFQMKVRDTQVGMKLFRRDVLHAILPLLTVERFAFDLEVLVVAHHLGFTRIVEAPITIQYQFSSSISWRAVYQMLWDTLVIFYRSRLLKGYKQTFNPPAKKVPTFSPILVKAGVFAPLKHQEQKKVVDAQAAQAPAPVRLE